MRDPIQKSWMAKRNKAIDRLVKAWINDESQTDDGEEPTMTATDTVTVAHIAATLEWATENVKDWGYEEGKAMRQLVRVWIKYKRNDEDDPEAEEELNIALDALAVAHTARAFEFCSGPLKW